MAFSPFDLLPFMDVQERTFTLLPTPVIIADANPTRVLIRFQLANFTLSDPIIGTNARISLNQDVSALSGFPVALGLPQEFSFTPHGPAVTSRWWGVIGNGLPQLTVLEIFWKLR